MTHSVKAKIGSSVPLNALRAFEAAARHKSIKEAALELSVTPSAVGHRIRILESALGQELFLRRRTGSRLELTEAGEVLAPILTSAFDRILDAVSSIQRDK